MTIHITHPDKCRHFWTATQLETQASGRGKTEEKARQEMTKHKKYKPELEMKPQGEPN